MTSFQIIILTNEFNESNEAAHVKKKSFVLVGVKAKANLFEINTHVSVIKFLYMMMDNRYWN